MPKAPKKPASRRKNPPAVETVAMVSLGCAKNLVDSEKMLGLMASDGLALVPPDADADALVVNTCGFLEASKQESLEILQEAAQRKKDGSLKRLVVAGCLVQRHRAKLLEWCPDIDALIGVFDRDHIVEAVRGEKQVRGTDLSADRPVYASISATAALRKERDGIQAPGYFESDAARLRLTPRHYAYLRISEGCNQNCAFCTIPSIRGKMRSKPVEAILGEARELLLDGAFELNLIGQDTTSYGDDIGYEPGLAGLLGELDRLVRKEAGGGWVRLMYAYPSCFEDGMIDAIAALPQIVKYIDMPLQHISDRVLESMRRRTSRKLIETLLGKLRDRVPGIAIRTTLISGYPTETDTEHRELVKFVQDFGFDHLGVFTYSAEPGTPAGSLHDSGGAVAPETAEARREEIMLAQQEVVFAANRRFAADREKLSLLIDAPADEQGFYPARSYRQAPDIDNLIRLKAPRLSPGELVEAQITRADGYDLIAEPHDPSKNRRSLKVL